MPAPRPAPTPKTPSSADERTEAIPSPGNDEATQAIPAGGPGGPDAATEAIPAGVRSDDTQPWAPDREPDDTNPRGRLS